MASPFYCSSIYCISPGGHYAFCILPLYFFLIALEKFKNSHPYVVYFAPSHTMDMYCKERSGHEMIKRKKYTSEFSNRCGEKWIFEYDYATGKGILKGSDID